MDSGSGDIGWLGSGPVVWVPEMRTSALVVEMVRVLRAHLYSHANGKDNDSDMNWQLRVGNICYPSPCYCCFVRDGTAVPSGRRFVSRCSSTSSPPSRPPSHPPPPHRQQQQHLLWKISYDL